MTGNNDNNLDELELARHGIERVTTDSFLWNGYKYSNAKDAIAAAKRGQAR